ncbi:MAG TPA: hypothetical protein VMZ27_10645 [Candidatus Saccharimonadales bacterium]|nr:hypothetical protein [Candidatus Saccharimonadales bacterium]
MARTQKTNSVAQSKMQWKYIRNLFFGQKVLDELRILMRLSNDDTQSPSPKERRIASC